MHHMHQPQLDLAVALDLGAHLIRRLPVELRGVGSLPGVLSQASGSSLNVASTQSRSHGPSDRICSAGRNS